MSWDADTLPPTQYLVMEVLAARRRLGETIWPFPSRLRMTLDNLEQLGLITTLSGNVERTIRARLTLAGEEAFMKADYIPPIQKQPEGR